MSVDLLTSLTLNGGSTPFLRSLDSCSSSGVHRPLRLAWLVLLVAIGVGWWWGESRSSPSPALIQIDDTATTDSVPSAIWVHVAGWVKQPGLVQVNAGARVADAIGAVGGVLPGARIDAINLAALVADGQQVLVPGPDSDPATSSTGDGKIHLNQATVAELDDLPGIGPVIAERIVAHREANGPFATVDDLLEVPGIGEAKLASLRDLVVP